MLGSSVSIFMCLSCVSHVSLCVSHVSCCVSLCLSCVSLCLVVSLMCLFVSLRVLLCLVVSLCVSHVSLCVTLSLFVSPPPMAALPWILSPGTVHVLSCTDRPWVTDVLLIYNYSKLNWFYLFSFHLATKITCQSLSVGGTERSSTSCVSSFQFTTHHFILLI